ncbi:MAG: nicotinate (nicotinamide) nucleotide adenylyltransferase [Candidatus Woesearchaeota archaeon]
MKIGLYGGSFNPIHFGHMEVMNNVLERRLVDEIWVMPCRNHVFHKDLASIDDRMEMLSEATKDIENVRVEDLEAKSNRESRTATSLRKLRKKNPDKNFYLIVGTDAANDISRWYDAAYIRKTTPFIIVERKGYVLNEGLGVKIEDVVSSTSAISSTDIRERVFCGLSIKGLVPKSVEQYIFENGLYKKVSDNSEAKYTNPGSTVDLIVPVDDGILFVKRKYPPFKDYWAFPGGFLESGKETLEEAAVRELGEETSLRATLKDLELLGVYSAPDRDPRGHTISHVYIVNKYIGDIIANDDAAEARVFKDKPEKLAFDHTKIYDDYKLKYDTNSRKT